MADKATHFNELPELVKDRIFSYLGGASLHICRQVCSEWDDYIVDRVWNVKSNKKGLDKQLELNWRNGTGVSSLEYVTVGDGFRATVDCYSSENVALRTRMGTPLTLSTIKIYNVLNKTTWTVPNPFQLVESKAQFSCYKLALSDHILGIRVLLKTEIHLENVQVFSLESRSKLVDEDIPLLKEIQTSKTKQGSKIMLVYTKAFIELWNFANDAFLQKCSVSTENTFFTEGSFTFPHVLQLLDFPDTDTTSIRVWKIDQTLQDPKTPSNEPMTLEGKVNVCNMDRFFHFENGEFVKFPVEEIVYLGNAFLVCCQVPLPGGPKGCTMLCFRICDDNGLIMKEYPLLQFSPDAFIKISIFEQRLICTVDRTVLIYNDDIKNLCDKSFKKSIEFQTIADIPGNTELLIRKTQAQTVQLVTFFGGIQMLRLRTRDFWAHNA